MLGKYDLAIQSWNDAKENIRHGEVVDYDSLHLAYMLCKSEICLNIAIAFYYSDMTDECNAMLDEARRYTIVKDDIQAVTQQMIGGEDVYPCTVDDTTLFNPPKLPQSVIDAMRKAGAGGGGASWGSSSSSSPPPASAPMPTAPASGRFGGPSYNTSASPPTHPKLAPPARAAPKKAGGGFGPPTSTSPPAVSYGSSPPPSAGSAAPPPPPPPKNKPKLGPKPKMAAPVKKGPGAAPGSLRMAFNSSGTTVQGGPPPLPASNPSYGSSSAAPPLPPPNQSQQPISPRGGPSGPISPRPGGPLSPTTAPASFSAPPPSGGGGGGPPGPPPPIPKGGIPQRQIASSNESGSGRGLGNSGGSNGGGGGLGSSGGSNGGYPSASFVSADALKGAIAKRSLGGSGGGGFGSNASSPAGSNTSTPRSNNGSPGSLRTNYSGPIASSPAVTNTGAPLSTSLGGAPKSGVVSSFGRTAPAASPAPPKGPAPVKGPGSFKFMASSPPSQPKTAAAMPQSQQNSNVPTSPRGTPTGEGIPFKILAEQGARKKKIEISVSTPDELRTQIAQAFEVSSDTLIEHYDPDFGEFVELDNGVNLSSLPTMLKVRLPAQ